MLHILHTKQLIKSDLTSVWAFISSPKNLAKITPEYMGFDIIGDLVNEKMFAGQIIEYHIKPIAGIKMHWVTEITQVKYLEYFVDNQKHGPYSIWHHKHFLKEVPGGVEMTDIVHYKLPFGILGKIINAIFIKKKIKQIFDFRYKKIEELFNKI